MADRFRSVWFRFLKGSVQPKNRCPMLPQSSNSSFFVLDHEAALALSICAQDGSHFSFGAIGALSASYRYLRLSKKKPPEGNHSPSEARF